MIGSVSTNRRAHAFAQALGAPDAPEEEQTRAASSHRADPPGDPEPGKVADGEHTALLALAEDLGALPKPALDPEVKSVQRAQLIAAMENQFAGGRVPEQRSRSGRGAHRAKPLGGLGKLRPKSRLAKGITAGGLTVGVAAGAFGGVAAASTDALPGDRLYGLKRGMEDLKIDMAGSDTARGKIHLDHASTRMNEARRLMERTRSGPLDSDSVAEVRRALGAMGSNAAEGRRLLSDAYTRDGDLGPLRSLSAFADSHRDVWADLRQRLPAQLHDVGEEVDSVFDAISRDVSSIRELGPSQPEHNTPGGEQQPGTDEQSRPDGSGADPGTGTGERPADDTGTGEAGPPSPGAESPSPEEKDEGFLGGGSGLLDPPLPDRDKGTGDSDSRPSGPDITIPPLLPGGLPGLGLETGRD